MRILFLTLEGLFSFAWEHKEEDWGDRALFFLDRNRETCLDPNLAGDDLEWIAVQKQIAEAIEAAESDDRVAWRVENPVENQRQLNKMIIDSGSHRGMNPNLPPADDVVFLSRAVCTAPGFNDDNVIA